MMHQPKAIRFLTWYYAALQLCHVAFLSRAAILLSAGGTIPFPAQSAGTGWASETIPFLMGMGAVDALAAGLALFSAWKLIRSNQFLLPLWVISVNIAMTSAVIFCAGTLPSGAWQAHPLGYGVLAAVFTPVLVYYFLLMRYWIQDQS